MKQNAGTAMALVALLAAGGAPAMRMRSGM